MERTGNVGTGVVVAGCALLVGALVLATPRAARAYQNYGGCRDCHGDFRAASYMSLADGVSWAVNLHNLHRTDMLNGDCATCHPAGMSMAPVSVSASEGGTGLAALSCMGCHGRAEDDTASNPDFGSKGGYGAGLRQHHFNAGTTLCVGCHLDSSPDNYTAAGEHVLPPYYASPGTNHPAIPDDPCNPAGGEDFAGLSSGLDNDGDGAYDGADGDCAAAVPDAGVPDAAPAVPDAAPAVPDAAPAVPDAAPGTPDAAPGAPDAAPGAPDAAPGAPDAAPGAPDAAPGAPDAEPVARPDAAGGGGGDDGDGGGCGCGVGERGAGGAAGSLALLLACAAAVRRRRR